MNAFNLLSNGLGFNNLADFGRGLATHFLSDVMERSIGSLGGNMHAYATPSEDMNRQKQFVQAALRLRFSQGWQWTVEVEGFQDFQLFAKDITYAPITIETEAKQIGGGVINKPTALTVSTVSLTVRDTEGKLKDWLTARARRVVNKDGTINAPAKYLMRIAIYDIHDDGTAKIADEYMVFPTGLGDISRSRDAVSEFLSYPITFTIYSSFSGNGGGNMLSSVGQTVLGGAMSAGKSALGNLIHF